MIIFDLDDTLIDTSGAVTPYKMKRCLEILCDLGLKISDFSKGYAELLEINRLSLRSKDALHSFILRQGGDPSWVEKVIPELSSPLPSDFPIPTTPSAKDILEECAVKHRIALVTGGHPPFQMEKLKKAGIEPSIFSKISIPEDSIKRPYYEALCKEFSKSPDDVIVCGDRILMDLIPARELGLTTVHMRWGRGLVNQTEEWIDYSISDLRQLRKIVR